MTVAELIEKLRAMPQNLIVLVEAFEFDFDDLNLYDAWATIGKNESRDEEDWWCGQHEDVSELNEEEREEVGAQLVIVFCRK